MARQSRTPLPFSTSSRVDNLALQTSGRAGRVVLVDMIPVLRGDSVGGQVAIDLQLTHMPKPLLNSVVVNAQAWFVPKSAHPQFASYDEFLNAYQQESIQPLGETSARSPKDLFEQFDAADMWTVKNSDHLKTLGLHIPANKVIHTDLFDAYTLVWNTRARAHSNKIARRKYVVEDPVEWSIFARAFWPQNRFSRVVADYEDALILGNMQLDVIAGRLPVSGLGLTVNPTTGQPGTQETGVLRETEGPRSGVTFHNVHPTPNGAHSYARLGIQTVEVASGQYLPEVFAEMAGQTIVSSLQDIDKARLTQSFAKAVTQYAGMDVSGFTAADTIMAELMQGLTVPQELFRRPWLVGNQMVPFGMFERHAMDGDNLEASTTRGRARVSLPINLPRQEAGGVILVTVEVLPERIYEGQGDPWLLAASADDLPNALRDVQRVLPVDEVPNWRVDARHTTPNGIYGFEAMNDRWNREYTRLGGVFFQPMAGSPDWSEARSALWVPEIVNPAYTADHFLAPLNFPHDVFSDKLGPAFECVVRRSAVIRGLTQIGDVLREDNGEYEAVQEA